MNIPSKHPASILRMKKSKRTGNTIVLVEEHAHSYLVFNYDPVSKENSFVLQFCSISSAYQDYNRRGNK